MPVVKNLMVRAGADFSGMRREMQRANQNLQDFKSGMSRTLKGIGAVLATLGIGAVVKDAMKSAMDVEASMQQINRTMGSSAQAFTDWANKSAIAFNMGRSDAIKFGAVYSNLISGFAKDSGSTMKYTQDLLKASAVVASGTGRTMTDVMERIRSGMLGNTESIEDLGINVNIAMIQSTNAFKRFANGKSWQQLDFQTQQQIRLFAILEQATQKYGSAVADNTNSRQQQFIAQLKNVQLSLGQAFLPIYNAILPALTRMAAALSTVMSFVAQFMQALFGKAEAANADAQAQAVSNQASAVSDLGDAYKSAGKKAKGSVAGFDQVNTLADSSGGGGSGGSGASAAQMGGSVDTSSFGKATQEISQKARDMAQRVKTAFGEMSKFIVQHKDIILAALGGLAAGFASFLLITNWGAIIAGIRTAFAGLGVIIGTISLPVLLIAAAIAAVVAAFIYFYQTNETFRGVVDGILQAIGDTATWLWNDVLVPFGQWLGDVLPKAWDSVKESAMVLWDNVLKPFGMWLADVLPKAWAAVSKAAEWLWKNILVPLGDFLLWFWNTVITPLAKVLGEVLGVAFDILSDIAKSFWKNVMIPLGAFLTETFGPAVEALSAIFSFLWNYVLQPLGTFLGEVLKPIFQALVEVIVFLWKNVLKPVAEFVGGVFVNVFDTVFGTIGELIGALKDIFIGLMTFITGVFTGDWTKAWEGIKQIFKGVFESLWGIVKFPLNLIIDGINALIRGLNSIKIDLPPWVEKLSGYTSFGISIPPIPKLAKGGITNGPMVAMIGDNRGGQEVVSPLDGLLDMIQSAVGTAILAASQFNNRPQGDVVLQIDGQTFARVTNPWSTKESSRIGGTMITET